MKFNFLFFILLFFNKVLLSQIGISIDNPTSVLDINGDLRIRTIIDSHSSEDISLVVDNDGVIKKKYSDILGLFRGYLSSDFTAPTGDFSNIYKITGMTVLQNPNKDFDSSTSTFKAPVSGYYRTVYTITCRRNRIAPSQVILGLVNELNGKWINKFTIPSVNISTGSSGSAFSFISTVYLEADQVYYLGTTTQTKILSNPSGATGTGLGTFFEIGLTR